MTRKALTDAELREYREGRKEPFVHAVIQATARRLGDRWTRDQIDFANLSISLTRLHRLLGMTSEGLSVVDSGLSFAILTQPYDDHVLGGALLEARLRNARYATEFFPSWSGEDLSDFGAVFVCVINAGRLEELELQLEKIRGQMAPDTPLIVGGPGVTGSSSVIGADLTTSSLIDAVDFCEERRPGTRL